MSNPHREVQRQPASARAKSQADAASSTERKTRREARTSESSAISDRQFGADVIRHEAKALYALAGVLDESFCRSVELLVNCPGNTLVTGMGKAGLIGQKIAATLASTGTRAHFLHPAEAVHGDLGRVEADDVVILLSNSGETDEITSLLPSLTALKVAMIAITGRTESRLAKTANETLWIGECEEAGALGLAPSTSTTSMLAVGDALALAVSRRRGFKREDFARCHPGGSLGHRLAPVDDFMRPIQACRVALETQSIRQVLVEQSSPERRPGAVLLVNANAELSGIFTDSDLARLLEQQNDSALDRPIENVMTRSPLTVVTGTKMDVAVATLGDRRISELPVVNIEGRPIGVLDITDVIATLPANTAVSDSTPEVQSQETHIPHLRLLNSNREDA